MLDLTEAWIPPSIAGPFSLCVALEKSSTPPSLGSSCNRCEKWPVCHPRVECNEIDLRGPGQFKDGDTSGSFAGTTLRFSGQSYVRYRPVEARNWQVHFYLKTLQPWAVLMFTNETISLSLKVRRFPPEWLPWALCTGKRGVL